MANSRFVLGNPANAQAASAPSSCCYYIADTDAGKPSSGLNVGDLCYCVDSTRLYVADSATTWGSTISATYLRGNYLQVLSGTNVVTQINTVAAVPRSLTLPDVDGTPTISMLFGNLDLTGQNVSLGPAQLTTAGAASTVGIWRVSYFLRCTTADATAGTISFKITYTDDVGSTTETSSVVALTSTANRTQGVFVVYCASSTVNYGSTLTGIAGTSLYQLRVRTEFLGA